MKIFHSVNFLKPKSITVNVHHHNKHYMLFFLQDNEILIFIITTDIALSVLYYCITYCIIISVHVALNNVFYFTCNHFKEHRHHCQ